MKNVSLASLVVLIFMSLNLLSAEPKYYLHSLVEQTKTTEIEEVINVWIDFLYEDDSEIRKQYWHPDEVRDFRSEYCLFEQSFFQYGRSFTLSFAKPYILSVYKSGNQYEIKTMFIGTQLNLSDTATNNQAPMAIVNVIAEKVGEKFYLKNVLSKETELWKRFSVDAINYFVEPNVEIDTLACYKANEFLDSISNIWNSTVYENKINYYVSNSSKTINELVGFEFAFLGGIGSGIAFVDAGIILSGAGNFNYKHEICHIVFGRIENLFLSEGLASYFGGTGNQEYAVALKSFSKEVYPLDKEKIDEILKFTGFLNYYMLAAIVVEIVYKSQGIDGLKMLIQDTQYENSDALMLINQVCEMLELSEEELLTTINRKLETR